MKMIKKIVLAAGCLAMASIVFAQEQKVQKSPSASAKSETSVEEEYLNDVDGVVILSLAQSDEYDNKLVAMQFLEEAVNNGNSSPDVMKALNQLAGEGITSQSRTNGRLINNFPDIRRRACLALGKIKTEESKNYLVKMRRLRRLQKLCTSPPRLQGLSYFCGADATATLESAVP